MIKPIETAAFGRLFRSRHEARVACFLSHLGVKWEYEPQGFELPSGRYLPDFKVYYHDRPSEWFWIECKPCNPSEREIRLARELASATRSLVMFFTPETFDEIRSHYFSMGEIYDWMGHEKTETEEDAPPIRHKYDTFHYWDRPSVIDKETNSCLSFDLEPRWNWVKAFEAANAALSQRFEFGAAPA
jgi:hypothetical protein